MNFSEGLKYAAEVERARDLAWARKCEEEDRAIEEYNDFCNHLENEFKEFKAKYENQLRYISLEDLHDYIVYRYEKKILILNRSKALYQTISKMQKLGNTGKKNPDYSNEEEEEFDKECDMIRDKMADILYKEN